MYREYIQAIRNVVTNCRMPKTRATLMWPTILVLMKSWAQLDITTYSRYQDRNASVAGSTKRVWRFFSSWNSGVARSRS